METYVRLQLDAIRARITQLETGNPQDGWADGPAIGWKLQLLPGAEDAPARGYLHRQDCFLPGRPVDREQARFAVDSPDVQECDACRPALK